MRQYTINKITVIESDEGKTLTNGQSYSKQVYLSKLDSPSNWYEIADDEVPEEERELNPQEIVEILTGGAS